MGDDYRHPRENRAKSGQWRSVTVTCRLWNNKFILAKITHFPHYCILFLDAPLENAATGKKRSGKHAETIVCESKNVRVVLANVIFLLWQSAWRVMKRITVSTNLQTLHESFLARIRWFLHILHLSFSYRCINQWGNSAFLEETAERFHWQWFCS